MATRPPRAVKQTGSYAEELAAQEFARRAAMQLTQDNEEFAQDSDDDEPMPSAAPKKRVVKRRPPPRDDVEAKPLPWVPSSDGGVSFNLAAACNYALRKTQQPAP